jgi:hypothetical protein
MITTEKDFAKAVRRIGEIGDLLPRIATKVEGILFDTPSDPLEFEDYKMLVSLGKELCELSTSIPSPGQRLICENGMINTEAENANRDDLESIFVIASNPHGISLNGYQYVVDEETDKVVTFKSEKEAIQYVRARNPDLPEDTDAELLEDEYGIYIKPEEYTDVHAQEIDAMSEDEIDASVPDSSVKRAEELVTVKPYTGDMLLDIIKAHTEIAKVAYKAGRESK